MFADILGVVKLVPVNKLAPPVEAAYQFTVPDDAVAPNVTAPVPQTLPGVVVAIDGMAFIVMVNPALVTGFPVTQGVAFEVSTT